MLGSRRRRSSLLTAGVAVAGLAVFSALGLPTVATAQAPPDPASTGRWSAPFQETQVRCVVDADGRELCLPAAATIANLVDQRVLYWDALEGTENVNLNIVAEIGHAARNDRTRVLDLRGETPTFLVPTPEDAGAGPETNSDEYLPGVPLDDPVVNDGDLFCSSLVQLADGRVIAVGGTDYYAEPYLGEYAGHHYGVGELEGLRAARIFDPATESWHQSGSMNYGRWYPSLITLPSGDLFVASGVGKLIKPVYAERPLDSGRNAVQTETYDVETGTWTTNPVTANRSLPLYPRLHLLPNGHVYYDAGGQVFNPMGQAYDEAFWNIAASYDPEAQRWSDLGVPGLPGLALPDIPGISNDDLAAYPVLDELPVDGIPAVGGDISSLSMGFRGSTFSLMLPLVPGDDGRYARAEFLTAGGIIGVSPGTYLSISDARINRIDIDPTTGREQLSTRRTGPLHRARWYGTGVLSPTGEVLVFSGANRDEVLLPGTGEPITTPEMWDPTTGTWTMLASQDRSRTYHNTAMLLPDGRMLIGGHAPISTGYSFNVTLPGLSPNEGRDPTFEIFEPPYLFRGDRPTIAEAPSTIATGAGTFDVTLGSAAEAAAVAESGTVVLVRNTALTHLVDADQRNVVLPVAGVDGARLTVTAPPDRAVAPAGPYMLFVNRPTDDGLVPSVSKQVFVDAPVPAALAEAPAVGTPGDVDPDPIIPDDPATVFTENLLDALGIDDGGSAAPAAFGAQSASAAAGTDLSTGSADGDRIPLALLVLATALPAMVLLGGARFGSWRGVPPG